MGYVKVDRFQCIGSLSMCYTNFYQKITCPTPHDRYALNKTVKNSISEEFLHDVTNKLNIILYMSGTMPLL